MGRANKRYFGQASTTPLFQHRRRGLDSDLPDVATGFALRVGDLGIAGDFAVAGSGVLALGVTGGVVTTGGSAGVVMAVGAVGVSGVVVVVDTAFSEESAAAWVSGRKGTGGSAGGQGCVGNIWDKGSTFIAGAMAGIMVGMIG
jgi:hypothetical protein